MARAAWFSEWQSWVALLFISAAAVLLVGKGELDWDRGDEGVGVREGDEANEDDGELVEAKDDDETDKLEGNDWFSTTPESLLSFIAFFWARKCCRFSIVASASYRQKQINKKLKSGFLK